MFEKHGRSTVTFNNNALEVKLTGAFNFEFFEEAMAFH